MVLDKDSFLSYRAQVLNSMKVTEMQQLTDANTLEFINKRLNKFPKDKPKKK